MKRLVAFVTLISVIICLAGCSESKNKYTDYSFDYFDTATTIVGYADNKDEFDAVCDEIKGLLKEYHQLYNIYNRYEGVTNLCSVNDVYEDEHKECVVDKKIIDLLLYAKELYNITEGKMNVAMGSVLSIWHDYRTDGINNPETAKLPPMDKLIEASHHTNINNIIINKEASTVYLKDSKMSLDVGAIAKGYATEQIALYLEEKGIEGYLLNIGGNVRCVGSKPDGKPWSVGIENPESNEDYIAYLKLSDMSIVTSGNYQRYYVVDGKNYHHIINPDTLMPASYFRSVSVLCKDSGKADALSTALFNMTYEEGRELIKDMSDVEAMWVKPNGKKLYSKGFNNFTYEG